jgi:NADH-quinone oxidoreductase subunit N
LFITIQNLAPEIILYVGALLIISVDTFFPKIKKYFLGLTAWMFTFLSFLSLYFLTGTGKSAVIFQGSYSTDGFALFSKALILIAGSVILLFSITYVYKNLQYKTEFFALILFSLMGMTVLVSSTDLILIVLAFEFVSIPSYILVGYYRDDIKSREASLKYFLFGTVSAAILIMGCSLLYGLTGETNIYHIAQALSGGRDLLIPDYKWLAMLALVLVGAGFGFKIGMFPFQMWVPDVYEGAPTPVTAFLAVASKTAGIAILLRFFFVVFKNNIPVNWCAILLVIAIITMFTGNLMAISQKNIKRMLGYSSIAHVGYILAGIVGIYHYTQTGETFNVSPVLVYLTAYVYMNLGAFAVVILAEDMTGDNIEGYAGLGSRYPLLAFMFTVFLLSLAGLPPLAGFIGKFYIFGEIVNASYYVLVILAVLNSVISVYYYFRIVHFMYFVPSIQSDKKPVYSYSILTLAAMYICFAGTIFMGIKPDWIIDLASRALIIIDLR